MMIRILTNNYRHLWRPVCAIWRKRSSANSCELPYQLGVAFGLVAILGLLIAFGFFWLDRELEQLLRNGWRDDIVVFFRAITDIGQSQWYIVPCVIILLILPLLASRKSISKFIQMWYLQLALIICYILSAVVFSGLLAILFKNVLGRARPKHFAVLGEHYFAPLTLKASFASFPSGHATTIGCLTVIALIVLPKWRFVLIIIGALLAFSRIAVGSHYFSDTIAGLALGGVVSLLIARRFAANRLVFNVNANGWPHLRPGVRHTLRRLCF